MPVSTLPDIAANGLLASFPGIAMQRILPHLTVVQLVAGETLYEAGVIQTYVYFPVSAKVVLSYIGPDGPSPVSAVGNEGVIGIPLFLNGSVSPCRAVVSVAGTAYRIRAAHLTSEFNRPGQSLRLFVGYARRLTEQMIQSANCDLIPVTDPELCQRCDFEKACPRAEANINAALS